MRGIHGKMLVFLAAVIANMHMTYPSFGSFIKADLAFWGADVGVAQVEGHHESGVLAKNAGKFFGSIHMSYARKHIFKAQHKSEFRSLFEGPGQESNVTFSDVRGKSYKSRQISRMKNRLLNPDFRCQVQGLENLDEEASRIEAYISASEMKVGMWATGNRRPSPSRIDLISGNLRPEHPGQALRRVEAEFQVIETKGGYCPNLAL